MRTIKRYSNRKLYDTQDKRYVTLGDVAVFVRNNEDVQVTDYVSGADLTGATLAQIIFEEEKRGPRLGLEGLRDIIRNGLKLDPAASPSGPQGPTPQG
jgi:polyhydroxyalkanoate synthesis repressor PhaR